jgi:hypothetical protein
MELLYSVGFGVLTAIVMKSSIFWDITPCSQLKVDRRFGASNDFACYLLYAGFLLGPLFNPEDIGDMFLRNVG